MKVLTDVNWADIGTKPLTKQRLEELLAMMPITRREGLDWAVKASTALAFLAAIGIADGVHLASAETSSTDVVVLEANQANEPNAPDSGKPRLLMVALIAYVLLVHTLAMVTVHRGWRWLFPIAASDDSRDTIGTVAEKSRRARTDSLPRT